MASRSSISRSAALAPGRRRGGCDCGLARRRRGRARAPRWLQRFPADSVLFLILARQLPIGPHIVNICAGALHVSLRRHLGCAAIAIVPEAVLVAGLAVGLFG